MYKNALSPIVKAFMANGRRYNLVNSAILELFDFIRLVSGVCVYVRVRARVCDVTKSFCPTPVLTLTLGTLAQVP